MNSIPVPTISFPSPRMFIFSLLILAILFSAAIGAGSMAHAAMRHGADYQKALDCFKQNGVYATFVEPNIHGDTIHNLCKAVTGVIYDLLCRINSNGKWEAFNAFMPKNGSEIEVLKWLSRKDGIYQTQTGFGYCW